MFAGLRKFFPGDSFAERQESQPIGEPMKTWRKGGKMHGQKLSCCKR
jgi:hypothetical protein